MCRAFLTVIAIGLVAGVYAGDDDSKVEAKPLTAQGIQDLANKLGDTQFRVRDAASKRLDRMGAAELEVFRKLDFGKDAEARRRAEIIIQRIESRIKSDSLNKVFSDWQKRQEWFESAEYEVQGKHKVPKGAYTHLAAFFVPKKNGLPQIVPGADVDGDISYSILLDLARGRHRHTTEEQVLHLNSGTLNSRTTGDSFDGSWKGTTGAFLPSYHPVFLSLGRIPTPNEPILRGLLRKPLPREELYLHGKGVYEGRNCLIMRTHILHNLRTDTLVPGFNEFWVDPERESAIIRYLTVIGERADADFSIRYQMSHGHWLVDSWRMTAYRGGNPLYIEERRVKKLAVNVKLTDRDFGNAR